jgi:hypothetical protein
MGAVKEEDLWHYAGLLAFAIACVHDWWVLS